MLHGDAELVVGTLRVGEEARSSGCLDLSRRTAAVTPGLGVPGSARYATVTPCRMNTDLEKAQGIQDPLAPRARTRVGAHAAA
jgi:hypothetical protein